jgi:hypothetical protein
VFTVVKLVYRAGLLAPPDRLKPAVVPGRRITHWYAWDALKLVSPLVEAASRGGASVTLAILKRAGLAGVPVMVARPFVVEVAPYS